MRPPSSEVGGDPASAVPENDWSYFPEVVCISLRERDDRYREVCEELRRVGLSRVNFLRTERQPDRDKAIVDAHMACLRRAVELGVPHLLVFEDDVLFLPDMASGLERSVQFLRSNPDWKIFHLGGFIFRKAARLTPHLVRGGVLTTHAYVIRTAFAREVLERRPYCSRMSIDVFYSALVGNAAYVHVNPLICIQRPSSSDGTWDKRSLNKEGWLGKAMIYSSLDFRGRLRFSDFSPAERFRVENGLLFFKFFRWFQRRRLQRAEARARVGGSSPVPDDGPVGEWREEVLQ